MTLVHNTGAMKLLNLQIEKGHLEGIATNYIGNRLFAAALEELTDYDLLFGLAQYIQFNSVFGAGVSNLAGEIARRQDLFRDPDERSEIIAEQSVEVAAKIFFAAIDEFGHRKTHRTIAKETLRATAKFFGLPLDYISIAKGTSIAIEKVSQGYCLNQSLTESDVFRSIGFHMGSELLADEEFNILNEVLQRKHPCLVRFLKDNGAYTWIQVHTTVEADHFNRSIGGANLALKFYSGQRSKARALILEGFNSFGRTQTQFMQSLRDLIISEQAV